MATSLYGMKLRLHRHLEEIAIGPSPTSLVNRVCEGSFSSVFLLFFYASLH